MGLKHKIKPNILIDMLIGLLISPLRSRFKKGPLAQLVEHLTFNQVVEVRSLRGSFLEY